MSHWLVILLAVYLAINLVAALLLHLHAERQAHLHVRFMDILMHFVLLSVFAVPVLLVMTWQALFSRGEETSPEAQRADAQGVSARAI